MVADFRLAALVSGSQYCAICLTGTLSRLTWTFELDETIKLFTTSQNEKRREAFGPEPIDLKRMK